MTEALPKGIVELNQSVYNIDPDVLYPQILKELDGLYRASKPSPRYTEIGPQFDAGRYFGTVLPDLYWLEVVYQIAKLDARFLINKYRLANGMAGLADSRLVFQIKGGEGYKERWSRENHEPGNRYKKLLEIHKTVKAADKAVALETRDHFKRLRGYFPA